MARSWVALALSMSSALACAQSQVMTELQSVEVAGVRDPEAFDVAKGMALMRTFDAIPAHNRSKIRLSFQVQTRDRSPLPPDLQIKVATEGHERPLALLPSGELLVPALDEIDAAGAEIIASVRRGTVQIVYVVQPRLTQLPMTLGYLREALTQARGAWAKLYGPLRGWTVPNFTCVRGHYAAPSVVTIYASPGVVAWRSDSAATITVPTNDPALHDEFVVDWGPTLPGRIGGCVADKPVSDQ